MKTSTDVYREGVKNITKTKFLPRERIRDDLVDVIRHSNRRSVVVSTMSLESNCEMADRADAIPT